MKTIEVARSHRGLSRLLAQAHREDLLLRSPSGGEFILAEINDFEREVELQKRNVDLMAFLDRRGRRAATTASSEVRKRLGLSTRRRSAKRSRRPGRSA